MNHNAHPMTAQPSAQVATSELAGTPRLDEEQRQRCEVWTRVMGYHRPVSQFNAGKRSEHQERQHFTEQHTGERRFLDHQTPFESKAALYRTEAEPA